MANEILNEFIEDAREHLQSAGQHILALEKDAGRIDELNGLLRRLHSIKGNSGFLDLRHLYSLLHKAENVLQIVREMPHHYWPPGLVDLMFQVLDTVEVMIQNLENGDSDQVDWLDNLYAELTSIETALSSAGEQPPAPATAPAAAPAAQSQKETGSKGVAVEAHSLVSPAAVVDPIEIIRSLLNLSLKHRGESFFENLSQGLESFSTDRRVSLAANSARALELVESYLSQLQTGAPPASESARDLVLGLLANLMSWLEIESACPPEAAGIIPWSAPDSSILVVTTADLEDYGKILQVKINDLVRRGVDSPILDLRQLQVLHSQEIGALISSMKLAPDQKHLGIILDETNQQGLSKVFRVMGLDKIYSIFQDENQARTSLEK